MAAEASVVPKVLTGHVLVCNDLHGFITPMGTLPSPYPDGSVYFSSSLAKIDVGRKVEFILSETNISSPTAQLLWICEEGSHVVDKVRCDASASRIKGKVVERNEEHGLIRPSGTLPQGYQNRDVHFLTELADVDEGDDVEFTLKKGSEEKPTANGVWDITEDGDSHIDNVVHTTHTLESTQSTSLLHEVNVVSGNAQQGMKGKALFPMTVNVEARPKETENIKRSLEGQRIQGSIHVIKGTFGFINVTGAQEQLFKSAIYFSKSDLRTGGLEVEPGDEVRFTVGVNKAHSGKWRAYNVKVTKFQTRSQVAVSEIIGVLLRKVHTEDENSDCLQEIMNITAVWELIGNSLEMSENTLINFIFLILNLEKKSKALLQSFNNVLEAVGHSTICNTTSGLIKVYIDKNWSNGDREQEECIKKFLLILVEHLPHKARMVITLSKAMFPKGNFPNMDFLLDMLQKLTVSNISDIDDLDWNELPLVPGTKELLQGPMESYAQLNPVKRKGSYESPQEYMDIYFRLLRADCFNSLTSGIRDFLDNKLDPRDMNIYKQVELVGINIIEYAGDIALAVKVCPQVKIKNWETCSNLMFGNLLCFSPSGTFKDPIWATVKQRNPVLLKCGQIIWVELCSESNSKDDMACLASLHEASGRTIMAETPTYYVAYQSVLGALQNMDPDDLPFQEELIQGGAPQPSLCFQDVQNDPPPDSMDKSQKEGFKHALKQRLSIIQGPPGTGKTYIGIEIIRMILRSDDIDKFPVLVLTYKNHALDEFLRAVFEFIPDGVARVGGRSRDPILQCVNINHLKKTRSRTAEMTRHRQELFAEAKMMKESIEVLLGSLEKSRHLSWKTLIYGLSGYQIESLLFGSLSHMGPFLDKLDPDIDLEKVWESNKEIILDEEMMPDCKIQKLNSIIQNWMDYSISVWMPPAETLQSIMTNEERLSSFLATQSQHDNKNKNKNKVSDEDAKDENDLENEQRERLSAVWHVDNPLEMGVKFNMKTKSHFPGLIHCAKHLTKEVPLTSIKRIHDVWELQPYDIAVIIQVLLWHHRCEIEEKIKKYFSRFKSLHNSIRELENQHKALILKSKKVIGMTISGASIHHQLLQALKPAVVLVEEAAEVLEPQLMAVLGNWVKQLFLIGDHKQLRPQVENFDLVKNYNFDLSMMERLIENGFPYKVLCTQNRMRPEMAVLLRDIYPDLQSNMDRVKLNLVPDFLPSSMYFWNHEDMEGAGHEEEAKCEFQIATELGMQGRSLINLPEAERAICLAFLFIQQGYKPSDITILAAYQGQVKVLRIFYKMALSKHRHLFAGFLSGTSVVDREDNVGIYTIDMYQGDENKIVIVSLVRSNSDKSIGFLNSLNRRCVAQSRAKCGMYFIGNTGTLMSTKSPWRVLIKNLGKAQLVGHKFPIICTKHPDDKIMAVTAADIPLDGICKKPCIDNMDCGIHRCTKICQPFHSHKASECEEEVNSIHKVCGHAFKRKCCVPEHRVHCKEKCPKLMDCKIHPCTQNCQPAHSHLAASCMIEVKFNFTLCGHKGKKKCGEDESHQRCEAWVSFAMKTCSHLAKRKCFQDESEVYCKELCPRTLLCGHPCSCLCGEPCDQSKCEICNKMREIEAQKVRTMENKRRLIAVASAEKELAALKAQKKDFYVQILAPKGDTASEYFDIEDHAKRYIQSSDHWFPEVTKITHVFNQELEAAWLEAKIKMFDPSRSELKFHATSDANIEQIMKEGFRVLTPGGRKYGGGICFGTSYKNFQAVYPTGSNKLLLCDVLLGKSLTVENDIPDMGAEYLSIKTYDSLFIKHGRRGDKEDKYIVYNPAQALPKYFIEYKQCEYEEILLSGVIPVRAKFSHQVLKPKRDFDTSDPLDLHFRIAESQFMRLTNHYDSMKKVTMVDYFVNPALNDRFIRTQKEFDRKYTVPSEKKPILAFHGTPTDQNIISIVTNNFDLKRCHRGLYGVGVYFSEFPDVSKTYAGGINKLILCKVLPGRSLPVGQEKKNQPIARGYDSHIVNADVEGRGKMIVIDNPDQILPTYVITYG